MVQLQLLNLMTPKECVRQFVAAWSLQIGRSQPHAYFGFLRLCPQPNGSVAGHLDRHTTGENQYRWCSPRPCKGDCRWNQCNDEGDPPHAGDGGDLSQTHYVYLRVCQVENCAIRLLLENRETRKLSKKPGKQIQRQSVVIASPRIGQTEQQPQKGCHKGKAASGRASSGYSPIGVWQIHTAANIGSQSCERRRHL